MPVSTSDMSPAMKTCCLAPDAHSTTLLAMDRRRFKVDSKGLAAVAGGCLLLMVVGGLFVAYCPRQKPGTPLVEAQKLQEDSKAPLLPQRIRATLVLLAPVPRLPTIRFGDLYGPDYGGFVRHKYSGVPMRYWSLDVAKRRPWTELPPLGCASGDVQSQRYQYAGQQQFKRDIRRIIAAP